MCLTYQVKRIIIAQPHQVEALMDVISSKDKTIYQSSSWTYIDYIWIKANKITYPTVGDWLEERSN